MDCTRFRFVSSIDVPLILDAPDWRTALCLGLQIVEREDAVDRVELSRDASGITAFDPETGEMFLVVPMRAAAALARAA